MKNITTYINESHYDIDDLANDLYDKFEDYAEFENIVDDYTFSVTFMKDELNDWKDRIKQFNGLFDNYEEENNYQHEIIWTWNLEDFDENEIDYDILYNRICKLFDYLG